jgi:hypothetical protein
LTIIPGFVKISKQNSQEKIQHYNVSENDQANEVNSPEIFDTSHAFVHDVVPALSQENLENGEDRSS